MNNDDQVFIKKKKIPWRVIDNEAVIVDLMTNNVLQLNETGRHIWEMIDGDVHVSLIIDSIIEEFDIERDQAKDDTLTFIDTLLEKGLIEHVSS